MTIHIMTKLRNENLYHAFKKGYYILLSKHSKLVLRISSEVNKLMNDLMRKTIVYYFKSLR